MKKTLSIIFLFTSFFAVAHPMPNSVLSLNVKEQNIEATLQLPLKELEIAFGKPLDNRVEIVIDSFGQQLKDYVQQHIKITSENGQIWQVLAKEISLSSDEQEATGIYNELIIKVLLTPPTNESKRKFMLNYDVILHQVVTHSTLVKIKQDWSNGLHSEMQPLEVGVIALDIASNSILPFQVNLGEASLWKGFKSIFKLGMSHIFEGTDHLLFLLVLLLPAPLLVENRRWTSYIGLKKSVWKLLKIITAFTIGHSVTLLLGTLGFIPFSSRWIEIMIAFSILVSAIHAIFPIFYKKEIFIAAGFGLIHGLAFSNTLIALDLSKTQMALSVLGFNLGIETMQLIIMCLILPCFLIICNMNLSVYKNLKFIGALLSIIAALAWITQRITDNENILTKYLDKAPDYLLNFILILIVYTVWIWVNKDRNKNT